MRIEVVWGFSSASLSELAEAARDDMSLVFVEDPRFPIDDRTRRAMERIGSISHTSASVNADGIVTFSDAQLAVTAERAGRAGLPFHSARTAQLLTRKDRQRASLAAAGLRQPKVHVANSAAELRDLASRVRPPVVIKPVQGTGSQHVYPVATAADFDDLGQRADLPPVAFPLLIESRIEGVGHPRGSWLEDFVSVESVSHQGTRRHFGITARLPLRTPLRETGSVYPPLTHPGVE